MIVFVTLQAKSNGWLCFGSYKYTPLDRDVDVRGLNGIERITLTGIYVESFTHLSVLFGIFLSAQKGQYTGVDSTVIHTSYANYRLFYITIFLCTQES